MNITRDIINDLYPLYAEKECSADTRALVEAYLQQHPEAAAELRRAEQLPLGGAVPPTRDLGETRALRQARRQLRRRSWLLALAIFCTAAPMSFIHQEGKTTFLFDAAPGAAAAYVAGGIVLWGLYFLQARRGQVL